MRTTRILLAAGCVGGIALGTLVSAKAQYYYPRPPDYGYAYPPTDDRYGYGWTWNDCPPGWTVQGGNCAPYKGPVGGGWRTWNGCPPGYTIQGGACQPHRGAVGPRPRSSARESLLNQQIASKNHAYEFGIDPLQITNWQWPF